MIILMKIMSSIITIFSVILQTAMMKELIHGITLHFKRATTGMTIMEQITMEMV